jgi:hypothetical protein
MPMIDVTGLAGQQQRRRWRTAANAEPSHHWCGGPVVRLDDPSHSSRNEGAMRSTGADEVA